MQYRYFEMIINDFSDYISPLNEASVVKGIPMSLRDHPTIKEFEQEETYPDWWGEQDYINMEG